MTLVPTTPNLPNEIEAQWKLAQRLCNTEFVPNSFRGKPENILAAILTGGEHGIGPMQALQSINVIQGKPTLAPELMRALVARAGHRVDTVEYTESTVTLKGTRSDTGAVSTVTWTMDDAKRAGLTGKGAWKTYPRSMLLARATAELCRLMFPDIIAGLSYTEEELGGEPTVVQVAAPSTAAAPLLPHEIDEPSAQGPSVEQGTGETEVHPPAPPVPAPAPEIDSDDEVAEGEIVDEGDGVAPLEAADSSVEAAPSPDVGGTVKVDDGTSPTPAPDETWSPAEWREKAKAHGVSQRGLILQARTICQENGIDLTPSKPADLIHPELAPLLRIWLGMQ